MRRTNNKIYIFNLRGNQRTSGELSRKEGGKIFGSGSRAPIAITVLVKNSKLKKKGEIYYHDIGDYLDRKQKLNIVRNFKSIKGIKTLNKFKMITPNEENDWINKGLKIFKKFNLIGTKKPKEEIAIFNKYSGGLKTSRDTWNYNFSEQKVNKNVKLSINFYNTEVQRYLKSGRKENVEAFVTNDSKKITWDRPQRLGVLRGKKISFNKESVLQALYRPFTKCWAYTDTNFNNCTYQLPYIFPNKNFKNKIIVVPGGGSKVRFSTLITDIIPDLGLLSACQCFPIKLYQKIEKGTLFDFDNDSKNNMGIDGLNKKIFDRFKNF